MDEVTESRRIASVSDEGSLQLERGKFLDVWADGTVVKDVSLARGEDVGWELTVRGNLPDGNCHAVFVPVDFTPEGDLLLADERLGGSCTGDPCSECQRSGGGCKCADNGGISGKCNHTITFLKDMPIFVKDTMFLTG